MYVCISPPPHLLNLHLMPNAHRWNPINHISSALSEHMFGLQDNCTHPPLHRAELQGSPPLQLTHCTCIRPPLTSRDTTKAAGFC